MHDHDIAGPAEASPLNLDSQQVPADVESKVGTPVLGHRPQNPDPCLQCGENDRLLGDGSLDVRIHHERMFACGSDGIASDCRGNVPPEAQLGGMNSGTSSPSSLATASLSYGESPPRPDRADEDDEDLTPVLRSARAIWAVSDE
jgi:hypothetical protein